MDDAERKLRNEKICEMLKQGKTRKELAAIFNVSLSTIDLAVLEKNGRTRKALNRKGRYHYDS